MAIRLSRRKITSYIAGELAAGKNTQVLVNQLAAYLIDSRRTKELELIVRDIEYELKNQGVVLARITSAFDLTAATRTAITKLIKDQTNAKTIELKQFIDPSVLGGFKIDLPGLQMDATISHRLTTLRTNLKK
jgi:F-type H+-transporting ATPase subunit delta